MTFPDPSQPMTLEEARATFGAMLDGAGTDEEIATFLVALAERDETAEEIAGAAQAMRDRMIRITAPETAIDVCGTGGDGQHTLNVSTAVALVVAACGVAVAKHGNRAASSKAGGADTLEALGVNLDIAPEVAEAQLADLGICFLFAQNHHPALKRMAPIRKAIGRRTIFNLLGPLANPAGVKRQLVGVAQPWFIDLYRDAMLHLGYDRAMIVSGWDQEKPDMGFLDELSISNGNEIGEIGIGEYGGIPTAYSHASQYIGLSVTTELAPNRAVFNYAPMDALKGGDPEHNASAVRKLLLGEGGAYRDSVLLNAAGALIVAGEVSDWKHGIEEAAEAIDKGLAKTLLDCWIAWK